MTEDELNAKIESELNARIEAELQAKRARERADIAARIRREEAMAHLDKVNRRHPIQDPLAGLTREQHAARLRAMSAASAQANKEMDIANSRPVEGSLLFQRRKASMGGSEGFKIKSGGS